MLFHLLVPLADTFSALNVFRYLTFRSIGAALTALLIAFVVGPILIRMLEDRQLGQNIHEDAPDRHQQKTGTPTMGGVLILFALVSSTLIWSEWTNPFVWIVVGVTLGCGAVGLVDDYLNAVAKKPEGLRSRTKLLWLMIIASAASIAMYLVPAFDAQISVPLFKELHPNIGWLYPFFAAIFIAGFSNAVNLTDGLDGLAIGPAMITAGVIGIFSYVVGNSVIAGYLDLKYVESAGTLAIFCAAMMGAGLGFLWFNTYPASVFMGDTGALALGGALATIAVIIRQEIVLIVAGGIFMVEMFSVIAQVVSFRVTGRRIFAMAPIHHHYELKGWPEPQIIVRFWIVSIILGLVSLSLLKLR